MSAIIIDGKRIADDVKQRCKEEINMLKTVYPDFNPTLNIIQVEGDSASDIYVRNKTRACNDVGISPLLWKLKPSVTTQELLDILSKIHRGGTIIQLPLPAHIDSEALFNYDNGVGLNPLQDVDGLSKVSIGALAQNKTGFKSCTAAGIMTLIKSTGRSIEGKHAVVVGRSDIVGKPVAMMLLNANATVTVCHSKTANLAQITRQADILVVAVGKADFIKKDMVKPGAIVIDVGINRIPDGNGGTTIHGDVDKEVYDVAGYITPVPGGVGLMTVAKLLENTVLAEKLFHRTINRM